MKFGCLVTSSCHSILKVWLRASGPLVQTRCLRHRPLPCRISPFEAESYLFVWDQFLSYFIKVSLKFKEILNQGIRYPLFIDLVKTCLVQIPPSNAQNQLSIFLQFFQWRSLMVLIIESSSCIFFLSNIYFRRCKNVFDASVYERSPHNLPVFSWILNGIWNLQIIISLHKCISSIAWKHQDNIRNN